MGTLFFSECLFRIKTARTLHCFCLLLHLLFMYMLTDIVCMVKLFCLCCCVEELEKAISLTKDSVLNEDVFNAIISSLECEGEMRLMIDARKLYCSM